MAGKPWTSGEVDYVRANYLSMSCADMAENLPGRTTRAVQHLFGSLGLERPKPKVGDELHHLTILDISEEDIGTQKRSVVRVRCRCGAIKERVRLTSIVQGKTVSCGCVRAEKARERTIQRNTTHGMSQTRLYRQWAAMHARCRYESQPSHKDYGGRGIDVCEEWRAFEPFRDWALANGYADDLQIDRIDNDCGYEPDNCRWVTEVEQANNRRSNHVVEAFGERKTIAMWLADQRCQVASYGTLLSRLIHLGWTPEEAISTPPGLQGNPSFKHGSV